MKGLQVRLVKPLNTVWFRKSFEVHSYNIIGHAQTNKYTYIFVSNLKTHPWINVFFPSKWEIRIN